MTGGIFLVQGDDELIEMTEQQYDSEDLLQELLAKYPSLLASDQIKESSPRRWLLIKREMGIPGTAEGGDRWSVDHLFLDQDAIPTLVEVKRSTDTRIRREVVGQMLDYAANAVVYWPVEAIRAEFESHCDSNNRDAAEELADFLGDDSDVNEFWHKAKTNLQAGRIRMVFVADSIPRELRRIVEFLNGQMDPAIVLAVEIKQFVGPGMKTLVPKVVGQTEAAQQKKSGTTSRKLDWDETSFFKLLQAEKGEGEVKVARALFDWARDNDLNLSWGKGEQAGSFKPNFLHDGFEFYVFSVWTYGRLETQFKRISRRKPFNDEAKRRELQRRLNELPGVSIPDSALAKRPGIALSALFDEASLGHFLNTMKWMIDEIKSS